MEAHRAAVAEQTKARLPQVVVVSDHERHLLYGAHRLRVAHAAGGLPAVEDGVWLLLALDAQRQRGMDWVKLDLGWTVEIVRRPPEAKGWLMLPKRSIVERTFGWLERYRRLARDYEQYHRFERGHGLHRQPGPRMGCSRRMLKLTAK